MAVIHNKCKKCKEKLVYELVDTDIFQTDCCGEIYTIVNEANEWKK